MSEQDEGNIWEKVNGVDLLKMLSDAVYALEEEPFTEDSGSCAPVTFSSAVLLFDFFSLVVMIARTIRSTINKTTLLNKLIFLLMR